MAWYKSIKNGSSGGGGARVIASVTGNGSKTYKTLLNELWSQLDNAGLAPEEKLKLCLTYGGDRSTANRTIFYLSSMTEPGSSIRGSYNFRIFTDSSSYANIVAQDRSTFNYNGKTDSSTATSNEIIEIRL